MNRHRLWVLARTYWFDALIVAALGLEIAWVVVSRGTEDGPSGPLWFDVLFALGTTVPLSRGAVSPSARPPRWAWSSLRAPSWTTGSLRADSFPS